MSRWKSALTPARSSVAAPMIATTSAPRAQARTYVCARDQIDARGHHRRGVDQRGTGVGPAMASGSQVCRGSCADLPTAPPRSSSAAASGAPSPRVQVCGASMPIFEFERPEPGEQDEIPMANADVPDSRHDERLLCRAAVDFVLVPEADEQVAAEPTPSQPKYRSSRLSASTSVSIDATNRFMYAKKRA